MATKARHRKPHPIIVRDKSRCAKCGRTEGLHVHHIVARQDKGTDDPDNLIALCAPCHMEWHFAEAISLIPFSDWLNLPTYSAMVISFSKLPATTSLGDARAAAEMVIKIRNAFGSFRA